MYKPVCTINYEEGAEGTKWAVYFAEQIENRPVDSRFRFLRDAERYIIDAHRKINLTERAKEVAHDYDSDFKEHYQ